MGALVGRANQDANFAINQLCGFFGIRFLQHLLSWLRHVKADVAHLFIHAVVNDLSVGALCDFLQIILSAGCDATEEDLLRHSTTQCHAHPVKELLRRVQILLFWQILCVTQTFAAGDDRDLDRMRKSILSILVIDTHVSDLIIPSKVDRRVQGTIQLQRDQPRDRRPFSFLPAEERCSSFPCRQQHAQ